GSAAACAKPAAFLDLGGCYGPGQRAAQLFRRLQRELDGDPRAGPQGAVHKIDRDRLFQQGMVGMIVGYDRMGQLDPPVTSLAGTSRIDDLDDRRAHAALCRQVLLEKREDLLPPIERLLDAIRRPVVIEETVPGAV